MQTWGFWLTGMFNVDTPLRSDGVPVATVATDRGRLRIIDGSRGALPPRGGQGAIVRRPSVGTVPPGRTRISARWCSRHATGGVTGHGWRRYRTRFICAGLPELVTVARCVTVTPVVRCRPRRSQTTWRSTACIRHPRDRIGRCRRSRYGRTGCRSRSRK